MRFAQPYVIPDLSDLHLEGANLAGAQLQGAILTGAHLQRASLSGGQFQEAILAGADLQYAGLLGAQLEGANLSSALLQGAFLHHTNLQVAILWNASLDVNTRLIEPRFDARTIFADVLWNGVALNQIEWEQVPRLGDEATAKEAATTDTLTGRQRLKTPAERLRGYQTATRAYRQLAVALRGQGSSEAADRFTYRALIMQRKALWWQLRQKQFSKLGSYLFSLFLAGLTGYGFRMWRILVVYGLLVGVFALGYWSVGIQQPHDLSFWQALAVSITAFHGRVFLSPFTKDALDSAQIWVTAAEAICGLVIEGVFIAMLTQRFFNR